MLDISRLNLFEILATRRIRFRVNTFPIISLRPNRYGQLELAQFMFVPGQADCIRQGTNEQIVIE